MFGCGENLQTLGATVLKTTAFILEEQLYHHLFATNQNRESVSRVGGELSCLVQEVQTKQSHIQVCLSSVLDCAVG